LEVSGAGKLLAKAAEKRHDSLLCQNTHPRISEISPSWATPLAAKPC
jgi:hypothetical protein